MKFAYQRVGIPEVRAMTKRPILVSKIEIAGIAQDITRITKGSETTNVPGAETSSAPGRLQIDIARDCKQLLR
jgi:hypothetical protein